MHIQLVECATCMCVCLQYNLLNCCVHAFDESMCTGFFLLYQSFEIITLIRRLDL